MSEHTEGKWQVQEYCLGFHLIVAKKESEVGSTITVARTCYAPHSEANAKLIAAAPDMLKALNEVPILSKYNNAEEFIAAFEAWRDEYKLPAINKATK